MNTQLGSKIAIPGINVIVKSPTLESLTSRSFEEYIDSGAAAVATPVQQSQPQQQQPPKPKRRFVFTDSKDSDDDAVRERKIDRKFERLSSEIGEHENVDAVGQQFDETYADLKDDASELQNEFSKLSYGDSTTSDVGSNTPDNDLQGEFDK